MSCDKSFGILYVSVRQLSDLWESLLNNAIVIEDYEKILTMSVLQSRCLCSLSVFSRRIKISPPVNVTLNATFSDSFSFFFIKGHILGRVTEAS